MSGLNASLSIALGSLLAEQGALSATANNVANVNTPGFSRQRPALVESDPVVIGRLTFGTGVTLQKLESLRDPILQLRIEEETQQQGGLDAFVTAMQQVEVQFNDTSGGDIGTKMSAFFSSLQQLSVDPTKLSLRQGVLTAAGNLATSFNNVANTLSRQRGNLDQSVSQAVSQINTLTGQIAKANAQISHLENVHQDASAFIDQRDLLISQLAGLIDISVINSDKSLTLTTTQGTALVSGATSFGLTTQLDSSGVQHIFSGASDITGKLTAGKLAGLLQVRDQKIPALLSNLDTLAAAFANAENTAHRAGFDLTGDPGGDLFVPPAASGQGAAAGMAVAITDPALVAASSDGSPAGNGNVVLLAAVHDQKVVAGQTPSEYYSNLVFGVGNDVANGSADQEASQLVLQQLEDQRASISGVSLDEEAANMLRFQSAYNASARLVTTINEMMQVAVNLGR